MSTDQLASGIRLYACAIVLGVWAILWAAGVRSDAAFGYFLGLTTVGVIITITENIRRLHHHGGRE